MVYLLNHRCNFYPGVASPTRVRIDWLFPLFSSTFACSRGNFICKAAASSCVHEWIRSLLNINTIIRRYTKLSNRFLWSSYCPPGFSSAWPGIVKCSRARMSTILCGREKTTTGRTSSQVIRSEESPILDIASTFLRSSGWIKFCRRN